MMAMFKSGWRTKALVAAGLSIGIHAAGFAWFTSVEEAPMIAGGAASQVAMMGNSFADLVAAGGVLQPLKGEGKIGESEPDNIKPVETQTVETLEADKQAEQAVKPLQTEALPPDTSQIASLPDDVAVLEVPAEEKGRLPRTEALVPLDTLPVPTARPVQEEDNAAKTKPERLKTVKPEKQASLPEEPKRTEPQKTPPKQVLTQGTGKGTADRDAIKGSADGRREASSGASKGSSSKIASLPGNAAASNYPGKVYSKIRRTRQRRAGGRGVVRVRFSVDANGGLGSVSVAQGSGNASVDQAAIDHIRRSAPFPAPPPGAKTRFVIPVEVRG